MRESLACRRHQAIAILTDWPDSALWRISRSHSMRPMAIVIPEKLKPPLRRARDIAQSVESRALSIFTPSKLRRYDKLQLGAGPHPIPGWANIDLGGKNLRWDLRKPLPLRTASIKLVYSEHFIEHVPRDDGLMILRNAHRAMLPGGTIRISTPDLKVLATDYIEGRAVRMEHAGWCPATPCQMVNEAVRWWGHVFIYDEPELRALLGEAGFRDIKRMDWGKSEIAELRNRETRPFHGDLILEAKA